MKVLTSFGQITTRQWFYTCVLLHNYHFTARHEKNNITILQFYKELECKSYKTNEYSMYFN